MPRSEDRPIIISKHARERMELRDISEAEVESVVRSGARYLDEITPAGENKYVAHGSLIGQTVKVAYLETTDDEGAPILLVKTVMLEGRKL